MEQVQTGTGKSKRRQEAGRKDSSGTSAVMDVTKLKEALPRLKKLLTAKQEADQDWNDGVTKEAEKAGLHADVVKSVVKAWSGDAFEEKRRKAEQLHLAFEESAKA